MAKTIPLLDLMFFLSETKENPKHVAALIVLEAPADARKDFVARLAAGYRKAAPRAPFNQVAQFGLTHLPRWVAAHDFDMAYHVKHTVLPRGTTQAQLLAHVARSHEELLDRNQPVFQAEFIEGLSDRRFAVYLKIHHAMVDGASAIARILASLSETSEARAMDPFFAVNMGEDAPQARRARSSAAIALKNLIVKQTTAGRDLSLGLLRKQFGLGSSHGAGSVPFKAPRGPMNTPMEGKLSFAVLSLPIDEMKEAGKAFGGTLNDVAIAVVDAALTRYLKDHRRSAPKPLVAMCPLSLREAGDKEATTKVSAIFVPLGEPAMKIGPRIEQVIASTASAKDELRKLSKDAAMLYAIAAFGLAEVSGLTHADTVVRPLANLVLSNVPGSRTERYLGRARVLGMYPVSALGAGIGLNATLLSYGNSMDFGFIANGTAMPDLEKVAAYTRAAFAELRRAAQQRVRTSAAAQAESKPRASNVPKPSHPRKPSAKRPTKGRVLARQG